MSHFTVLIITETDGHDVIEKALAPYQEDCGDPNFSSELLGFNPISEEEHKSYLEDFEANEDYDLLLCFVHYSGFEICSKLSIVYLFRTIPFSLTWSEQEDDDDEEIENIPISLPVDRETIIPLQDQLTHKDTQDEVVEDKEQPSIFLGLKNQETNTKKR